MHGKGLLKKSHMNLSILRPQLSSRIAPKAIVGPVLAASAPKATELTPEVADLVEQAGIDYSVSALRWLPAEAQVCRFEQLTSQLTVE